MNTEYTAVIKQDQGWWIGWIEEVPGVNCQEKSRELLLESLRENLTVRKPFLQLETTIAKNPSPYETQPTAAAHARAWL